MSDKKDTPKPTENLATEETKDAKEAKKALPTDENRVAEEPLHTTTSAKYLEERDRNQPEPPEPKKPNQGVTWDEMKKDPKKYPVEDYKKNSKEEVNKKKG